MPNQLFTLTPAIARRLAITRQYLAGPRLKPTTDTMTQIITDIGCLQLDPINAIARSHTLVLWSRLGKYNLADLETLLWREHRLFEYWAHCASIVPSSDYALHHALMRDYRNPVTTRGTRTLAWIAENQALRDMILTTLAERGPLGANAFEEEATTEYWGPGWTSSRKVNRMLDVLWAQGHIMVAQRKGQQRLWNLTERVLGEWAAGPELDERAITREAVQRSLRALGVAKPVHIRQHFLRGRYPHFDAVFRELREQGVVIPVAIADDNGRWQGEWFIHAEDMALSVALAAGQWEPRTTLLSPFDNLICDRARALALFDFDFRIEIYVPPTKRKYGYYVLPIVHGDQIIGRMDAALDRKAHTLVIKHLYAEPSAAKLAGAGRAVRQAIGELATFIGARDIIWPDEAPWKLRSKVVAIAG